MNWGTRIVILYVAFVAMISFMVIRTMYEDVDLVSNDYYQKELKFQQQIDRTQESQKLVEQPQAKIENGAVKIKFPEVIGKEHLTGNINFYRPNDSSKDLAFTVQTDSTGSQSIPTTKMQKGIYNLQLTWEASGKNYYNELSIYVP
ncbi:MAG: FixH family protein [Bacteroidetes bacterium]|jgi:hypothetical protein|nr:FixH family protein [Bacteroidota bacterium]